MLVFTNKEDKYRDIDKKPLVSHLYSNDRFTLVITIT